MKVASRPGQMRIVEEGLNRSDLLRAAQRQQRLMLARIEGQTDRHRARLTR
jgi:hypothetical protein